MFKWKKGRNDEYNIEPYVSTYIAKDMKASIRGGGSCLDRLIQQYFHDES